MFSENWINGITKSGYRATITKRLKNSLYWGYFYLKNNPTRFDGKHKLIIPNHILIKVKNINDGNPNRPIKSLNKEGVLSGGWLKCVSPECGLQICYDPKKKKIKTTGENKIKGYIRCVAPVKEVFELAINSKSLWKTLSRHERVNYLKKVCSNPVLDGLSIEYHLKKPFDRLAKMTKNTENEKWRRR